jgi:hypothetical protein
MTIKKYLFPRWPWTENFFIAYLSILEQCKIKGAIRAVLNLLRIWPLSA